MNDNTADLSALKSMSWSAYEAFCACPSKYDLGYNHRVVSTDYPSALACGIAFHAAREVFCLGGSLASGLSAAAAKLNEEANRARTSPQYENPDVRVDMEAKVAKDHAIVRAFVTAYFETWFAVDAHGVSFDKQYIYEGTEVRFEQRLRNPATGADSRTFRQAGYLDGLARPRLCALDPAEPRELLFVVEAKTTSKSLDAYEAIMRQSGQPSSYIEPIERLIRKSVSGVLVDIVKKPTIRGRKDEGVDEFGDRALEAYRADAGNFLRRFVVGRDEAKIREVQEELWRAAHAIRVFDKIGYPRPVGSSCDGAYGPCRYKALCWHSDLTRFRHREADRTESEIIAEPTE